MSRYARVSAGVIVSSGSANDLWPSTAFTGGSPNAAFLTDAGYQEILVPTYDPAVQTVAPGDHVVDGVPYSGTVRNLTPAELAPPRYAALLAGGLTITSTGSPSISGVYAISDQIEADLAATEAAILAAGGTTFPTGDTTMLWPLANGTAVVLTIDQFRAVGLALAKVYTLARQALRLQIATNTTQTWPSASVTIV